ncbi:MAG TPA: hypothetical protein VIG33_10145 [Pseudobdellovibrionaceae bacterium]|jgi:hypothetical protein
MREDRIIVMYLIFTLLFGGGILLKKIIHRIPIANSQSVTKEKDPYKYSHQNPNQTTSQPIPRVPPPQPTETRQIASIPKNRPQSHPSEPLRKFSQQTLAASRYSNDYDEGHDLSQKLDSLDYQERKEMDFLKMKVGLSEFEIQTLEKKRHDYQAQLQQFSTQEQQGSKEAGISKQSLIKAHIQWMANYLGPENYYEFLNLSTE